MDPNEAYNRVPTQQPLYDESGNPREKTAEEAQEEDEASFYNEKRNGIYILTAASVTMLAMYFVMQVHSMRKDKRTSQPMGVTHVGRANIGGPWKLLDLDKRAFGSENLAGQYYLIYFGFCNCPDVCPQSLFK